MESINRNTPAVNSDLHRSRIKRTLYISALSIVISLVVGFVAKGMILLINFFTQLSFYGRLSFHEASPSDNALGYWVILIPAVGGLLVGVMARYGSPAIRGHGIPEAMERIFKGESRIHPLITILKPLSAAISIGSGGPFGAEGPIISTGGALGSLCGQMLHITSQERKILLAAGATAGMTAIFGTPFAAILLAIELLLFEFSSRSFVPVIVACVTGACMHFLLFGITPTFPMPPVSHVPVNAIIGYSIIGLIIGFASVIVTKSIYWIEDVFEKLPIHWMWWPAIGGLAVGLIGTFAPATLGVGYQNITNALSGQLSLSILMSLCLWKFISWAIALGSGTSGGTLAPLLTIGSSLGCLLGMAFQKYFPEAGILLPLAALVGMAALFAGAARALLTSIVFAMETTMQESTLLPLIAGCVTSYIVSFICMRTTIMTEKIQRRGIRLPENYHPDLLDVHSVSDVMMMYNLDSMPRIEVSHTIKELRVFISQYAPGHSYHSVLVVSDDGKKLKGIIPRSWVFETGEHEDQLIGHFVQKVNYIYADNSLQLAVEFLRKSRQDILPIVERNSNQFIGTISAKDILKIYEQQFKDEHVKHRHISIRQQTINVIEKGRKAVSKQTLL